MADVLLTNSLTRKKETFVAINPPSVGMYTCGPTVYGDSTIGNLRTYTMADTLLRVLKFNGYKINYIMNLTDVGHLTGDNLGDADIGEDRLEKAAKDKKKTAWDVAEHYIASFLKDFEKLNLTKPQKFVRATDHIREQIALIKRLENNGLIYKISDGIYFDTKKFEDKGNKYGTLSTLDSIKEGARVGVNKEKKNPRDFALWKFSPKKGKRDMQWDSPWGVGFPGWHLECSAMSMKYLGESFDIHFGGEDLRTTHHPNEIAQSEGATGKKFVNYWVHGAFLKVDGGRMGKSKGNAYRLTDIEKNGFNSMALRYLYLTGKYSEPLNFTWEALESAQNTLNKLYSQISSLKSQTQRTTLSAEKEEKIALYRSEFIQKVSDDLNTPQALAVLWEVLKSSIPSQDKYDLAVSFDEVLGLKLNQVKPRKKISTGAQKLMDERDRLRKEGKFEEADKIRIKINKLGYKVKDEKLS
ncbi:cysteine--tRNA ligase [Patescibacteria group bacterium]